MIVSGVSPMSKAFPVVSTRVYHLADKVDRLGRIKSLCFGPGRAVDLRRESWTTSDDAVTCSACLALMAKNTGDQP